MVSYNGLRNAKMHYDVVEEELSSSDTVSIICGHHLGPFSEVVDNDDNIVMPPSRAMVTCHEVYAPFSDGPMVTAGCKGAGRAHYLRLKI